MTVYLDNAASTPLDPRVLEAMMPHLTDVYGNATALHGLGRQANTALEQARSTVARLLGAKRPNEIIFTSGGTESDNAAILGITQGKVKRGNKAHVAVSNIEHHAVLNSAQQLVFLGHECSQIPCDKRGFIQPDSLVAALRSNTMLVSVMAANNEIGTVQDIVALAKAAHDVGACFHTDAVQALGKVDLHLDAMGVDAASFSGHKIHGPKGVGVLYLRSRTPFRSQMAGGGQEAGMRSGTPNVAGAVGFAKALELACQQREQENAREQQLRDHLADRLLQGSERIHLVVDPRGADAMGECRAYLPGMLSIVVEGQETQTMLLRLDEAGFCVSGGSACSSGSLEPSHVLKALGIKRDLAYGALRISLGHDTSQKDVDDFANALLAIV
ncbi:MAG: cysteine desulfurase [Coriobacteriales bacterium]|nr:cysteine desulfurase [Coriobacteriales bacterium]